MKKLFNLSIPLLLAFSSAAYAINCQEGDYHWLCTGGPNPGSTEENHTSSDSARKPDPAKIVTEFYELALNRHQPALAADLYLGDSYIQHNPLIADGKDAFVNFVKERVARYPRLRADIKNVSVDGDKVLLHVHSRTDENDRGRAIVDIFRVKNGRIIEHWDVIQAIPESSANSNGMF